MPKDSAIKKLRLILDNKSNSEKISEEDKKYINDLKNRLKKQNQEIYYKKSRRSTTEESLKPKVTVYKRKKHIKKVPETKTETSESKTKIKIEGEELFEIEKTTDEIESLINALIKEGKTKDVFSNVADESWLKYFFSASIFIHSKELSKLNRLLLFLTAVLIVLAIIQIILLT